MTTPLFLLRSTEIGISISDLAIAKVAAQAALESYGIVDTASRHFTDTFAELFRKDAGGKGVKVVTSGNRIYIDISVLIKYGVSIEAVAESLKEAIKYKVENFTGMIVDTVNVNNDKGICHVPVKIFLFHLTVKI